MAVHRSRIRVRDDVGVNVGVSVSVSWMITTGVSCAFLMFIPYAFFLVYPHVPCHASTPVCHPALRCGTAPGRGIQKYVIVF